MSFFFDSSMWKISGIVVQLCRNSSWITKFCFI